jgi:cytochrome c oxidase subunit 2
MLMSKWWTAPILWAMAALAWAEAPPEATAKWNMPIGVTEISREVHGLHMLIFWVVVAIGVVVFSVMFYSIWAHRRSKNPTPATFHESTTVEIIWTVIPFVILIAMAIPATGTLIKIEDMRGAEMSVKVTGYQWLWEYEYVDTDVRIISRLDEASNAARQRGSGIDPSTVEHYLLNVDNRLVLPTDTKIRFLITANDVIHSWWVPAFGMKRDAIPGFINEMWTQIDTPGVYRGQCAELCGRDHGFMPIVVEAIPPEEFKVWLAEQQNGGNGAAAAMPAAMSAAEVAEVAAVEGVSTDAATDSAASEELSRDALMATGEKVYGAQCSACHRPEGQGMPPAFPSLIGSQIVLGDATTQITQTLNGKGAMPPFRHLSDADIAAAITYTRNAWGNDAGMVQPAAVAAQR